MKCRFCLYAACAMALSVSAAPIGLRLASISDADADDDGTGATVEAQVPGGGVVLLPEAWLVRFADVLTSADFSCAVAVTNTAVNGRMSVAECYVLGIDPENGDATNDLRIVSFPMKADGTPDVEHIVFEPPQSQWNVPGARAVIKGAAALDAADWPEVTEQNKASFRFFKVEVALP